MPGDALQVADEADASWEPQIRTQLAKEMTQDLRDVSQENASLMRETVTFSFNLDNVVAHPTDK